MHLLVKEPEEKELLNMSKCDWRKYIIQRFRRTDLLLLVAIVSNVSDLVKLGQDLLVFVGV